jgi:hypothetical protein
MTLKSWEEAILEEYPNHEVTRTMIEAATRMQMMLGMIPYRPISTTQELEERRRRAYLPLM